MGRRLARRPTFLFNRNNIESIFYIAGLKKGKAGKKGLFFYLKYEDLCDLGIGYYAMHK